MISLHHGSSVASFSKLYSLACGPDPRVASYSGCDVNGVRYHTYNRDNRLTTQNNGIAMAGEHDNEEVEFYDVLVDVLELQYLFNHKVILFKCEWFDTNAKRKRIQKDHNLICINVSNTWYRNDPFILASQAQQVFYVNDPKIGSNWKVVEKSHHRHIWDVPEMESLEMGGNEEGDISNNETPIHVVEEDINLETRLFNRKDVESTILDANIMFAQECTLQEDNSESIDDSSDEDEVLSDHDKEEPILDSDDDTNLDD